MFRIALTNVRKSYDNRQPNAVNDISLNIDSGSFTCILGPSGCGKSTLLRMIAGLEGVSDGEISIGKKVVDSPVKGRFVSPEKRQVGLVFQSYALWPHMTVVENIAFGLKVQKMSAARCRARVDEMLAVLRIEGLQDRYPAELSGGQQQRVALARTLALSPGVLLLDEPLSNLDATLRLQMRDELSRLHRELGTTIVFVTHDQWEAMMLATHIAVVADGRLQQMGVGTEIYDRPANRFVAEFIGNPRINVFEPGSQAAAVFADKVQTDPQRDAATLSFGLRPEAMTLHATFVSGSIPAEVRAVIPTGGSWLIECSLRGTDDDALLVHSTQHAPGWAVGETVYVSPDLAGLHVFDTDGKCLERPADANAETYAHLHLKRGHL